MNARRWLLGLALVGLSVALAASSPLPDPGSTPVAATQPGNFEIASDEEVSIGTWNLKFFYDDNTDDNKAKIAIEMSSPSKKAYQNRVKKTAAAIAKMKPTLLGLQEIENKKVVQDLAKALKTNHKLDYTVGFIQGKDSSTEQDVAFLAQKRSGTPVFERVETAGLESLNNTNLFKIPSKHLAVHVTHIAPDGQHQKLTVIVVHLKAGGGASNEAQRIRQCRVLNRWATKLMATGGAVIILGDFNAGKRFSDTSANDGMGVLRGMETPTPADDLFDLHEDLDVEDRRTHASGKELDRIVVSPNLLDNTGLVFQSIANHRTTLGTNATQLSDHFPLIAKFKYLP